MLSAADLELSLRATSGGEYAAELRVRFPAAAADTHREGRVRLAPEALPDPGPDPRAYGATLTAGLFADPGSPEAVAWQPVAAPLWPGEVWYAVCAHCLPALDGKALAALDAKIGRMLAEALEG